MKKGSKRVIPGFGLSMGVTLSILSIIVLIPLASLIIYTAQLSPSEFFETVIRSRVLASFRVSLLTAFIASAINAVIGVILAWVLVRYRFPCKRLLNGMIELPFALPTAVAGIALTSLTADTGLVGKFFARFGIEIAYTRAGITVALVFIGIPFVVRTVQPILEKLDPTYEEAAGVMGASRTRIFWKVIFPEILPATLTGFGLAFGRCLGEYGSVVFIAGNQPYEGQVAVGAVVMNRVRSGRYSSILAAIYAPGQFGVVSNGSIGRYLSNPKASCRQAAQEAINGYTTVGSFTHFKNAASPVSGDHIVIGNHVFY